MSAISRREQVTFQRDEDEVPTRLFVLFFAFCVLFVFIVYRYIYIYLKNDIGVHILYIIKLYISWRQATVVGIRNRNTVYIKFAKNNVREIDWNYLILTINKRLFTIKIENHDTTKLGSKHEHLLKREIQRMWTNIKLCLTTYPVHVIVLVLPHSTVIVRVLCVFTNYKIIDNIDFCSW